MTWDELILAHEKEIEACRLKWKDAIEQLQRDHREIFHHTSFTGGKASTFLMRALKREIEFCFREANRERENLEHAQEKAQDDFLKQLDKKEVLSILLRSSKNSDRGR